MRRLAGLLLAAALLWDLSGWDWAVSAWFGDAGGFAARHNPWVRGLLHEGLRGLYALLLAGAAWQAFRAWKLARCGAAHAPCASRQALAVAALLLIWLAVPMLKQLSLSSCPWSLAAFGGEARWVSHWRFGVADGGPGHCFPSGHAAGGFGFFALVALWAPYRHRRPGPWRFWVAVVLVGGLAGSWAQVARGAHFLSHCLWSAALCAALADLLVRPRTAARPGRPSPARA